MFRSGIERKMHLFYGIRNPDDIIYKEELERLAEMHDNLTVDFVISEPEESYQGLTGFINRELLRERLGDLSNKTFFLCGPEAMYKFCRKELENLGLRRIMDETKKTLSKLDYSLIECKKRAGERLRQNREIFQQEILIILTWTIFIYP